MTDLSGFDRIDNGLKSAILRSADDLLESLRDINWNNQTGAAQRGLFAEPDTSGGKIAIRYGGGVPYQKYLEKRDPHIGPTGEEMVTRLRKNISNALR